MYLHATDCLKYLWEVRKVHLLWTLDLLKGGDTEHKLKGRWNADEKTIRKWTVALLEKISDLGVVSRCLRASFDSFLSVVSPSFDLMPSHPPLTDPMGKPAVGIRKWPH